jgi:1,4-alpha-glucan branching enzyme
MGSLKKIDEFFAVMRGLHSDPYSVLGMHKEEAAGDFFVTVRAFMPYAAQVNLYDVQADKVFEMEKIHEDGLYELIFPNRKEVFPYQLDICDLSGKWQRNYDPYSFLPIVTEFDRHLFNEGRNYRAYEKLGAHKMVVNGIAGVYFSVWAPSAKRVSVIGDFNNWDGLLHQMRILGTSGIWEIFIPGLSEGTLYKFEIKTRNNYLLHKADPYGTYMQLPPETASVVYPIEEFGWTDQDWQQNRTKKQHTSEPMNIYEAHLGSWIKDENGEFLNYRELAHHMVEHCKNTGFTHIELMPVAEHPFYGSWGYQVVGYFAPTSRYGTPADFMYFVNHCHENGISVILDWVPAHFPKDGHGLGWFDGTNLYEHADPRQGEHRDWGTCVYNYGRNEVRNFLISNLLFWCEKYHIDGFRIDAVASMLYLDYSRKDGEWIPNRYGGRENLEAIDFIREANDVVHEYYPGTIMIAEESTAWPMVSRPVHLGGLGFDFKWNMGWMNDMLSFISQDPIFRQFHMSKLTFGLWYAYSENFVLVLSHDEVVYGKCSMLNKMPGDIWQKFANLRLFYTYWVAHPGKKLLFMGGEIGQYNEWNHDRSLDWPLLNDPYHRGLLEYLSGLLKMSQNEPFLHKFDFSAEGFEWIDFSDATNTVVSFMRKTEDPRETLIFVFNFTPVLRERYRVGLPYGGRYKEISNSDSAFFGGSNAGNGGGVYAEEKWCQTQPFSAEITIPPLGAVVFRPLDAPAPLPKQTEPSLRVYVMPEGIEVPRPVERKLTVEKKSKAGAKDEAENLGSVKKNTKCRKKA